MIPSRDEVAANTLSAPYYPDGVEGKEFLSHVNKAGIILAGGLLADIKTQYFRVGHMGAVNRSDLLATVGAIETGLRQSGHSLEAGLMLKAAQQVLDQE